MANMVVAAVTSVAVVVVIAAIQGGVTRADAAAADLSQCQTELTNLLSCLPYVQGKATVPAATCCTNLQSVHEKYPQCLCELIVASVPGSSVAGAASIPNINTTLALQLAPACNVKTTPSRCPGLLGIDPNSAEAKIFQAANTSASPTSSSNSPSSSLSPSSTLSSPTSANISSQHASGASDIGIRLFFVSAAGLVAWFCMY